MTIKVRGVVATAKGAPVELTTVLVPDPGPGEALVRVQACGVCHTDLHYREGGIGDEFPYLLGHEAAGVVEAVGSDVTDVAPGDFVILNWRAVCGQCRACARGRPWYCFATHNASQKMTLEDGTPLSPALGIGAFVDNTLVAAGQCTKVNPAIRPEVAGLLGCGVMAGIGAAINTGGVTRGDSVAVIGCGGVGSGALLGASLAGARDDHRRGRGRPQAGVGPWVRRDARDQLQDDRSGARHQRADRRVRRRRGDRGDRPARDLRAGVLRARPGRARWCSSACPPRRCGWTCRCSTSSAGAARSSRPGTATACPAGTSPCWWICTCRGGCRWTGSCPRRSRVGGVEEAFAKMSPRRGAAVGGDLLTFAAAPRPAPAVGPGRSGRERRPVRGRRPGCRRPPLALAASGLAGFRRRDIA